MKLVGLLFVFVSILLHLSITAVSQNVSDNCHIGLRAETHLFSLHHYPQPSETWQKVKSLLVNAQSTRALLFIADPSVFAGVGDRLIKMLAAVNIKALLLSDYQMLLNEYMPGHDLLIDLAVDLQIATVHPEWECAIPIPPAEYKLHNRIIVQSEQLNGRFRKDILPFLHACHNSPTCVIWEYSDYNYKLLKEESEAYLSTIVLPVMFQDLPPVQPLPLALRTMDHFGAASVVGRRKEFIDLLSKYSKDHSLTGAYGLTRKADQLVSGHQHARVCLCIHVESSPSPGEYHRLSDVVRYGCVPVYEKFADLLWSRSLTECGNIHFAESPQEVILMSHMVSANITAATDNWQKSVDDSLKWWEFQLVDINFVLKDIFFPSEPRHLRGKP